MSKVEAFLQATKAKCEARAKQMAALELSIHDDANHQKEMKQYFGYTDQTLAERKAYLQKNA